MSLHIYISKHIQIYLIGNYMTTHHSTIFFTLFISDFRIHVHTCAMISFFFRLEVEIDRNHTHTHRAWKQHIYINSKSIIPYGPTFGIISLLLKFKKKTRWKKNRSKSQISMRNWIIKLNHKNKFRLIFGWAKTLSHSVSVNIVQLIRLWLRTHLYERFRRFRQINILCVCMVDIDKFTHHKYTYFEYEHFK